MKSSLGDSQADMSRQKKESGNVKMGKLKLLILKNKRKMEKSEQSLMDL